MGPAPHATQQSIRSQRCPAEVIDSVSIGARQKILLVRVRDQEIVVGVSPQGMTALSHVQHPAANPGQTDFAQTLADLKDNAS